jgi:hypothetical protein
MSYLYCNDRGIVPNLGLLQILSFLGAIHWGLEFAGYGGSHHYRRYAIGVVAPSSTSLMRALLLAAGPHRGTAPTALS